MARGNENDGKMWRYDSTPTLTDDFARIIKPTLDAIPDDVLIQNLLPPHYFPNDPVHPSCAAWREHYQRLNPDQKRVLSNLFVSIHRAGPPLVLDDPTDEQESNIGTISWKSRPDGQDGQVSIPEVEPKMLGQLRRMTVSEFENKYESSIRWNSFEFLVAIGLLRPMEPDA